MSVFTFLLLMLSVCLSFGLSARIICCYLPSSCASSFPFFFSLLRSYLFPFFLSFFLLVFVYVSLLTVSTLQERLKRTLFNWTEQDKMSHALFLPRVSQHQTDVS